MNASTPVEKGMLVAGRYRLEEMLGQGGHAVVWGAVHLVTNKRVALKIIDKPGPRALIEARAAAHLEHPNVIAVHDVFEDAGRLVIVMDWLVGESLSARIERLGPHSVDWTVDRLLPVLEALDTAHRAGIVHRDLKPSNIFVVGSGTGEERLVLLDFGIAKVLDGLLGETAHTESGAILGTPQYMAPEQLFGEPSTDARADLWSLGIVLAELLSGRRPTDAPNVGGVLKRITTREIVSLRQLAPDLPSALLDHVDELLSFDAAMRPASVERTMQVLRAIGDGTTEPTAPKRRGRGHSAVVAAAGVALLLSGILFFRAGASAPRPPEVTEDKSMGSPPERETALDVDAATTVAPLASTTTALVTAPPRVEDAGPAPRSVLQGPRGASGGHKPGIIHVNPYAE